MNPAAALPRIEQALAARGKGFSACNHGLLQTIAEIHYDPVLEELAIQSLDDPDPEVAMTAAMMLGHFGSPAAESALWRRYASWSAQWLGRESQLDTTLAEGVNENVYKMGLGQNLMQALATGKSWLSDKAKLQRLSQLTKVRRVQEQLDEYLKNWDDHPLTIFLAREPSLVVYHARLAQYEFQSLDALKEKLTQFPSGTKFLLAISPVDSSADDQTAADLRTFLSSHGMSAVEEKRAH